MMQMVHSELFCRLLFNIFSKIVRGFCDDPEDIYNARVCSPNIKRGLFSSRVRGRVPPSFFFYFFFALLVKTGCKWCIWIIPSRLGVGILLKCHIFCHESPDVEGMWCGSFPLIWVGVFFPCRRGPWFTVPPPNILTNWCNIHSETFLSDWTFLLYIKLYAFCH